MRNGDGGAGREQGEMVRREDGLRYGLESQGDLQRLKRSSKLLMRSVLRGALIVLE